MLPFVCIYVVYNLYISFDLALNTLACSDKCLSVTYAHMAHTIPEITDKVLCNSADSTHKLYRALHIRYTCTRACIH